MLSAAFILPNTLAKTFDPYEYGILPGEILDMMQKIKSLSLLPSFVLEMS